MESSIGAENSRAKEGGLLDREKSGNMKGNPNSNTEMLNIVNLIHDSYTKRVRQIRNPIRNIKQNTTRKLRKISKSDDGVWFGNKMLQNPKGCQLFLQNPNGIDLNEDLGEFRMKLDEMIRFNIHFWLLPETNLNRNDYVTKRKISYSSRG